jgi:hypothetical protein
VSVEVTARDTESGEAQTMTVPTDSYVVITEGRAYIASKIMYRNGTQQLTIKVDRLAAGEGGER